MRGRFANIDRRRANAGEAAHEAVYGYPASALRGDYIRAIVGAALCFLPLAAGQGNTIAVVILLALGATFVLFGVRTWMRQVMRVTVSEDEIRISGSRAVHLSWTDISELSLSYFSTWRNRDRGWMQLKLRGDGRPVRIESSLSGFEDIVRRAVVAASARGLELNAGTVRNLSALGIRTGGGLG
jgi:hypothetical protein